jgi:hypothetical protein
VIGSESGSETAFFGFAADFFALDAFFGAFVAERSLLMVISTPFDAWGGNSRSGGAAPG